MRSANPSTVTICAPCARGAGTRQAITALPSKNTVHAPHSPSAQPSFVPISAPSSRNKRRSDFSCPLLKVYFFPLTVVSIGVAGNSEFPRSVLNSEFDPFPQSITGSRGNPACSSPSRRLRNPRRTLTRTISRRYAADARMSSMGRLDSIARRAARARTSSVRLFPAK